MPNAGVFMHTRKLGSTIVGVGLLSVLIECSQPSPPQATAPTPSAPAGVSVSPSADAARGAPSSAASMTGAPPTVTPMSASPSPSLRSSPTPPPATPTPDLAAGLTIPDLRSRRFGDGEITVGDVWQRGSGYTSYRISYLVDGLRLTGLLHRPDGDGPFPVIIANRGTIARDIYQPGMDSRAFSDLMARNGFLVVAP